MARTRHWTDPRDGKLWWLRCGLGVDPGTSLLFFTRGPERRTVLLDRQAELDDLTDEELELLLDKAQRELGGDA